MVYNDSMRKSTSGFTIIELLVSIVVIGILVSIATISYNGVQKRTQNEARASQLQGWDTVFKRYKAAKGSVPFPSTANDTGFCLGTGFPTGAGGVARCRDYMDGGVTGLLESNASALMTELRTVTPDLPSGPYVPVGGTVGPYVYYWGNTGGSIQITGAFYGFAASDCPTSTTYSWKDDQGLLICSIYIDK
jgi:prepilin-type N-terminal cleavage/methylation domain-containing protein